MIMAEGFDLVCRDCGKRASITEGMYYAGGWDNPMIRERIMEGKYGQEAKDALEAHPDALYHVEAVAFHCKGHYIGTKDCLIIYSNDLSKPEAYFISKPKCPKCRKELKPWNRGKVTCPKCKGVMEIDEKSCLMID